MVLVAFRHGLRVTELVDLRWDQVDFDQARLQVRRAKQGTPAHTQSRATKCGPFAGCSGSRSPSRRSYSPQSVARRSPRAALPTRGARWSNGQAWLQGAPPHASSRLRFHASQQGARHPGLQAYLGHKNIQHTVRYTELSPNRFKDFWKG